MWRTSAKGISRLGLKTAQGITPIVPGARGRYRAGAEVPDAMLLEKGVFVSGFGYPVVPQGHARLRAQICAAHTPEQLDRAVAWFEEAGRELGLI